MLIFVILVLPGTDWGIDVDPLNVIHHMYTLSILLPLKPFISKSPPWFGHNSAFHLPEIEVMYLPQKKKNKENHNS